MPHRSITSFLTHDAPDGGAATLAQVLDARVREGELVERAEGGAVRCFACGHRCLVKPGRRGICKVRFNKDGTLYVRSEEHTSELQSLRHLVCRLLLEKKKKSDMMLCKRKYVEVSYNYDIIVDCR